MGIDAAAEKKLRVERMGTLRDRNAHCGAFNSISVITVVDLLFVVAR